MPGSRRTGRPRRRTTGTSRRGSLVPRHERYGAPVDRAAASRIAHGDLTLYNPLSEADLDEAIGLLELPPRARVLDVACGPAEVLRRIAARWEIEGVGYDADAELIERAREALAGPRSARRRRAPGRAVGPGRVHRVEPRAGRLPAGARAPAGPRRPGPARRGLLAARADAGIPRGARRRLPRRAAELRRAVRRRRGGGPDSALVVRGERAGLGPLRVDAGAQRRAPRLGAAARARRRRAAAAHPARRPRDARVRAGPRSEPAR